MSRFSPIAVVGMAGIFPGAFDIDSFWQNIIKKRSAIVEVPTHRWILPSNQVVTGSHEPDKAVSNRAGLIDTFQPDLNGLALDKALFESLDPMHHLALMAAKEAYQQASPSVSTGTYPKTSTGVILAAIALPTDNASKLSRDLFGSVIKESLFNRSSQFDSSPFHIDKRSSLASRVTSLPAALIAQALGLGGGSYTLDAACSSSLFAVKLACDALQAGRADVMLAGGVSRPDCLYTQIGFTQLRALSTSGRCAPFDKRADGLVVGEGAGVMVLKRLDDAVQDGDHIYGVIRGMGLSNDMGGGLLSPLSDGQIRAMRSAYASAGWSPQDIQLIECHGAGTPVGDMTELESLCTIWEGAAPGSCAIGSVKSMIGHLLTAAGVAGLMKVLLGIKHHTLPPTLNFSDPPSGSPLENSPFYVQTDASPWKPSDPSLPRRAAVSAFGFGGTNAHLLIEEWLPLSETNPAIEITENTEAAPSVAITGMAVNIGPLQTLTDFKTAVFNGRSVFSSLPSKRWYGCESLARQHIGNRAHHGAFIESFDLEKGAFNIPPNELADIIPQHLLMLKTSLSAMEDAGMQLGDAQPNTGTIIGMGFDPEATNFHVRWYLFNAIDTWLQEYGVDIPKETLATWKTSFLDAISPPLTSTRTLGALGSMVASRIAKAFRFGAPSFVVSCEEASGLKAFEIGLELIQRNEADRMVVGAIDMAGDIRRILCSNAIRPFSNADTVFPFDKETTGPLPGEGAVAMVLKRYDQAEKDGDRIYSLIRGVGAGTGESETLPISREAYELSLERCVSQVGESPVSNIDLLEANGTGDAAEDALEMEILSQLSSKDNPPSPLNPCALNSVKSIIGDTGAVSGLASVVKTSLCLYHYMLPPLGKFTSPVWKAEGDQFFFLPSFPQYWSHDRKNGLRKALVSSVTTDGNAMHVLLEEENHQTKTLYEPVEGYRYERKRPLGASSTGLFLISGFNREALLSELDRLQSYIDNERTDAPMDHHARNWYQSHALTGDHHIALIAGDATQLREHIERAKTAISREEPLGFERNGGIYYSPTPVGVFGETAFVFPGSGNHFIGMGREIACQWPEILRQMDLETDALKTQLLPAFYVPQRYSWEPGWESDSENRLNSDPTHMIFGQVVYGSIMARLMNQFKLTPDAVIGYSLGESAGLFGLKAWPDRGVMLQRMQDTNLFKSDLAGDCNALRTSWRLPKDTPVDWVVAVVNRSAVKVRNALQCRPYARLLIVNTPDECVIGGQRKDVLSVIHQLSCEAIFLQGVVTVHCDAAAPVAEAYKELHVFPTTPPDGIRFYSGAKAASYDVTPENAADSILSQALNGFDFPTTIEKAYGDGVRFFLEMGPHASCTRMIRHILKGKPHLALSASFKGENEYLTFLKFVGTLYAESVPINLDALYGKEAWPDDSIFQNTTESSRQNKIIRRVGGSFDLPPLPSTETKKIKEAPTTSFAPGTPPVAKEKSAPLSDPDSVSNDLISVMEKQVRETVTAHEQFLEFSRNLTRAYADTFSFQTALLEKAFSSGTMEGLPTNFSVDPPIPAKNSTITKETDSAHPAFSRDMCMEFAIGSAAKVLGPEFQLVDSYPARVRLPDEPLMLVDRIVRIQGTKGQLGPGKIVTEHDVLPDAWYLDGGRAPVCISVEAGQADLFLCAYLGIDLLVKGKRTYRLLDATVEFFRGLPKPGEVIRYDIEIERFARQGDTHLFFFHFDGYIGEEHLIQMRNGCAGFFTEREVKNSGGIIFTENERAPVPGKNADWPMWVPMEKETYDESALNALRKGDLATCFGDAFTGISMSASLWLPKGRMKLIDRILNIDPKGGRYGVGLIQAEADVHPNDWFLTCHFVDDMVMPGTLMYECCAHTLRVFLQRMGGVIDTPGACYEPVIGVKSRLKCRGPVTPDTHHVVYEVEVKELGFGPEPFAIADAHMYADGHRIVYFENMSLKLSGVSKKDLDQFWDSRHGGETPSNDTASPPVVFSRDQVLSFASGKPSDAFGIPYKEFDDNRFIARLPQPPYSFIDQVVHADHEAWELTPGGWITAEYLPPKDAWYFSANRSVTLPYCILNEIALQGCGWLAAYAGSALKSEKDLRFRNLGGDAVIFPHAPAMDKRLITRARLTKVSSAGEMIIEHFEFKVHQEDALIYEGNTHFGFFTKTALAQQVGLGQITVPGIPEDTAAPDIIKDMVLPDEPPLTPAGDPDDFRIDGVAKQWGLRLPAKALRMVDRIDLYAPQGGLNRLGYVCGSKKVDSSEWFFKAHFFQDPVCPGSLGIESFLQLLKWVAIQRWPQFIQTHRFEIMPDHSHQWTYRGQITQSRFNIEVEATILEVKEEPVPSIKANGLLKVDGLYIYKMDNFGIRLVPITD